MHRALTMCQFFKLVEIYLKLSWVWHAEVGGGEAGRGREVGTASWTANKYSECNYAWNSLALIVAFYSLIVVAVNLFNFLRCHLQKFVIIFVSCRVLQNCDESRRKWKKGIARNYLYDFQTVASAPPPPFLTITPTYLAGSHSWSV